VYIALVMQNFSLPSFVCSTSCTHCPDVVEWCPTEGLEDYLAYGTYEFNDVAQTRKGALIIACACLGDDTSKDQPGAPASLITVDDIALPGVYDLAWAPASLCPSEHSSLLAVVSADGHLQVFSLCRDGDVRLTKVFPSIRLVEDAILTHVVWGAGDGCGLAAVAQDGSAHHVEMRPDVGLVSIAQRAAHTLEVWSVEVPADRPSLVLTGADDSCLLGWDLRQSPDASPALANRRSHEAGVTALACDPRKPHMLATGSYDERVRLFDLRAMQRGPITQTERLGDGAYHLSWHPAWPDVLACAAMRSGFPLLHFSPSRDGGGTLSELAAYAAGAAEGEHGSLGYGVSWRQVGGQRGWMAASASFYDRSVHVWTTPGELPVPLSVTTE